MFLRFVEGSTKMPLRAEDFKQKMNVIRYTPSSGSPNDALPHAHTCFFRLELPAYTKYVAGGGVGGGAEDKTERKKKKSLCVCVCVCLLSFIVSILI